jgi:predicted secreted protein
MRRLIVLAIFCAVPSALLAQDAAPAPATTPAAKPEKEKKICRREETTGSVMLTRVCHTKEEWVAIDKANQEAADQFSAARRNGHSGIGGSGN